MTKVFLKIETIHYYYLFLQVVLHYSRDICCYTNFHDRHNVYSCNQFCYGKVKLPSRARNTTITKYFLNTFFDILIFSIRSYYYPQYLDKKGVIIIPFIDKDIFNFSLTVVWTVCMPIDVSNRCICTYDDSFTHTVCVMFDIFKFNSNSVGPSSYYNMYTLCLYTDIYAR